MTSPSGTSSGSTSLLQNLGSDDSDSMKDAHDQKKRKRMQSNRESARRSRMRKQKHLDDLMAQVAQFKDENNKLLTTHKITTEQYLAMEVENCELRAQVMELSARMQSLTEITMIYMEDGDKNNHNWYIRDTATAQAMNSSYLIPPWGLATVNQTQQPIMASPDMFLY